MCCVHTQFEHVLLEKLYNEPEIHQNNKMLSWDC